MMLPKIGAAQAKTSANIDVEEDPTIIGAIVPIATVSEWIIHKDESLRLWEVVESLSWDWQKEN